LATLEAVSSGAAPTTIERSETEEVTRLDKPWLVVVWDDPINLMSYVTYVFQKLFGFPREKAHTLMLQVHNEGKAIVASGPRERCEADVARLHTHGLWATLYKED
jgi:ATP-dependent Clp protease adaptor protein ClpS